MTARVIIVMVVVVLALLTWWAYETSLTKEYLKKEVPEIETQNYVIVEPEDEWRVTTVVAIGDPEVGRLDWSTGKLIFIGNADESAKVFFEHHLKPLVDEYIDSKLNKGGEK